MRPGSSGSVASAAAVDFAAVLAVVPVVEPVAGPAALGLEPPGLAVKSRSGRVARSCDGRRRDSPRLDSVAGSGVAAPQNFRMYMDLQACIFLFSMLE